MIFGLTWEKLLLIGLLAAVIIGPERLPRMAESFARIVHRGGQYLRGARDRMREEMGPEIDEVDWRKLDPRQYDPRRIIRDALFEEPTIAPAGAGGAAAGVAAAAAASAPGAAERMSKHAVPRGPQEFSAEEPPPYDDEAT